MTATYLVHWTEERKEDGDLDAAISCQKKMPAVSGRKKCRQSRVGRYAGNFGSENMPAISGRKKNVGKFGPDKNASNIGSEQNVGNFEPEKNAGKFGPKKMPMFLGGKKLPEKRQLPTNLEDC